MTPLGVALSILFAASGWWIGKRLGEWAETSEPEADTGILPSTVSVSEDR